MCPSLYQLSDIFIVKNLILFVLQSVPHLQNSFLYLILFNHISRFMLQVIKIKSEEEKQKGVNFTSYIKFHSYCKHFYLLTRQLASVLT